MNKFSQITKVQEVSKLSWGEIANLENQNFSDPWPLATLQSNLKHPYFFFIYKKEKELIAYAIFLLALDSVDLLNISVSKKYQGTGLSSEFLSKCFKEIAQSQAHLLFPETQVKKCFLEVRSSNLQGITFYKKYGFKKISIRKAYYEDNKEDALVMLKSL